MTPAGTLAPGARVLVTGAAGFIGSHLCERLLAAGHEVVGLDCFTDFYPRASKERNLERARQWRTFSLLELDLASDPLDAALDGLDVVMHLAGQPGVRASVLGSLSAYRERNVLATRRLLEAARARPPAALVFASSSSAYGDAGPSPIREEAPLRPLSPYGETKAAAERLARLYHTRFGVPALALRYFSVYGPRQRPDMAFHRFICAGLAGERVPLIGDGHQVRDFTYVGDAVDATIAAAARGRPGAVYNIGGGRPVELRETISIVGELLGRPLRVAGLPAQAGEARRTAADCARARRELGYVPRTALAAGLAAQVRELESRRPLAAAA